MPGRSIVKRPALCLCALAAVLFLAAPDPSLSQDDIRKRQEELDRLREEIRTYETTIGEKKQNERATLDLLDAYDRKSTLVRTLIARLRKAEATLQARIDSMKGDLSRLEEQLSFLKKHYASYVTSVYKAGTMQDIELLLSARSINQAYIRSEYLRRFTEQRRKDAEKIKAKKFEIENLQGRLQEQLTEQRRLLAEKGAEEDRLAVLTADRRDVLQQIRKDRRTLQKEVDRKLKAAKELEDVIESLIETERVRAEKEREGLPIPPPVAGGTLETRKGRLRWPVSEGKIVARYGNQTHPTLKTVTQNPGIDIGVQPGTPVAAVAAGRVARIWWLVSYGNLIIIDHGGGYRTIYAHLAEIHISEGQEVAEGELIATSGETVDGARLHFELWKDREKQNPEQWLLRR